MACRFCQDIHRFVDEHIEATIGSFGVMPYGYAVQVRDEERERLAKALVALLNEAAVAEGEADADAGSG